MPFKSNLKVNLNISLKNKIEHKIFHLCWLASLHLTFTVLDLICLTNKNYITCFGQVGSNKTKVPNSPLEKV